MSADQLYLKSKIGYYARFNPPQRIDYKATYVQINSNNSPQSIPANPTRPVVSKNPVGQLSRSVEKTAFMNSLQIIPDKLSALRRSDTDKIATVSLEEISYNIGLPALDALVSDCSNNSTLNHASKFAAVEVAQLVNVGSQLIVQRAQKAEVAQQILAQIVTAYRASLITPAAGKNQTVIATVYPKQAAPVISTVTNNSGIILQQTIFPVASQKAGKKEGNKFQSDTSRATFSTNEVKFSLSAAAGNTASAVKINFSSADPDAITWAEKMMLFFL